ncbi:Cobalamin synthesis protein [Plasmopara halstedii]|uniref:Cobalamin synthesis protein n=1 Tax=Plasmopara halstedii TaxID=4781 RepID=A0A0P1AZ32_PLAHL|nr:Cobalamin synthesis protein [Plasmopara halstedii]CEG47588.1 Cobalamin synthesis protein [Plasmopara halstedii]|eukprot:XP_024583957.1 Cobalamin synthesis protein [Plasmopara halstedii]
MSKRSHTPSKLPVTILTGFLGSGKTTLLNHLLTENHGKKFAIIENEFGEVGVDDHLIRQVTSPDDIGGGDSRSRKFNMGEEILTMNNGCICCSVRGDLVRLIAQIVKRNGDRDQLDGIIIETTGMADPGPVVQTFFAEPLVAATCELDGIITVVDAKHILQHLRPGNGVEFECEEQIAFADRLLLNKTDLVSSNELAKVHNQIREINSAVSVIECQHCRVDPSLLLNVKTFDIDFILKRQPNFLVSDKDDAGEHSQHSNHDHEDEEKDHISKHQHKHSLVSSVGLCLQEPILVALLEEWIDEILETEGDDLLRYKGVINIAGIDRKYIFQGVHTLFKGRFADNWSPNEKRETRFVFIGKNLDREALTEGFLACRATNKLRFQVGDRVMANTGEDGFQVGTIVQLWDQGNPYAIQLDNDRKIWAPVDEDELVKALELFDDNTRRPVTMVYTLA